ncbi:MFS transporter [Streptomyces sp. NPDC042319]|uniref:MFS transporter n=1 Tax=Streptomyces sp. NPDC042319 TaxID=3154332 RepID=UPI003401B286
MGWGGVRVLRDRNAAYYLSGVVVSGFGSSAMFLAAGVWTKSLTGSDSLAALTTFCVWAPTLCGPLIGTVADRVRRRPLLIRVHLAMALALLPLLAVRSADRIWILFAVLLLYGVSSVLLDAVEAALVATAVPQELRGDFNGLRMTANEGMKLLAPLLGAGLFVRFGGPTVALLDAVTFAVAAAAFALLRVEEPATGPPPGERWTTQVVQGAGALRRHPLLWRLVLAGAATMGVAGLNGAAVYAVVDAGLHRPPAFAGVLYAVQGIGSVLSGLCAGALLRRMPDRVFAAAGILLFALGVALRALPSVPVALAASAMIGAGLPCVLIAAMTAVQREVPDALLGRAAATANTLLFAPNALTLAVGAGLVAVVDHRVLLPAAGALAAVAAVGCCLLTVRRRTPGNS